MSDLMFALPHEVLNPDEQNIADVLEKAKSATSLHGNPFAKIRDLGDGRCVKTAMLPMTASLQDACCTEYIRMHTSIPVPKVHMLFTHVDRAYTVMDFVEGKTLEEASYTMGYVGQIRALPIPPLSPNTTLDTWNGGPFRHVYFKPHPWEPNSLDTISPKSAFPSTKEFNQYWIDRSRLANVRLPEISGHSDTDAPVLAHGDLHAHNILVNNGKIVAVFHWETFGWYPEYWEVFVVLLGMILFEISMDPEDRWMYVTNKSVGQ